MQNVLLIFFAKRDFISRQVLRNIPVTKRWWLDTVQNASRTCSSLLERCHHDVLDVFVPQLIHDLEGRNRLEEVHEAA